MQPMSQSRISKNIYLNLAYSFTIGFLLFLVFYGFYDMVTSFTIKLKYSYIIVTFTFLFILSCAFLEQRGAKVPYLFGGGALVASILTLSIVCIVNGVFAIWHHNSLTIDIFVVAYSICSIVAFVGIKLLLR